MIVLLGHKGMVGSDMFEVLDEKRFAIPDIDVLDEADLMTLAAYSPTHIINCVGLTGTERCEADPVRCEDLNITAASNIALKCNELGAKYIHISSALAGDYDLYALSKLYAEESVRRIADNYTIFKTGWLFGRNNDHGFLRYVLEGLGEGRPVKLFQETGTPSYTMDVCKFIVDNLDTDKEIYLVGNKGVRTREEWAQDIAEIVGGDLSFYLSNRKTPYKNDSSFDGNLRPYREALEECLDETRGVYA